MGSSRGDPQAALREERRRQREEGEPLTTEDANLMPNNGTPYAPVTEYARKTLDIGAGDAVEIDIYPDRLVVRPNDE